MARPGWLGLFACLALLALTACRRGAEENQGVPLPDQMPVPPVATTTAAAQWLASSLLEGIARPELVFDTLSIGTDPATTPFQRDTARECILLIAMDGHTDKAAVELFQKSANTNGHLLMAGEPGALRGFWWMVPEEAGVAADRLAAELTQLLPDDAALIEKNRAALHVQLQQVAARTEELLAALPDRTVLLEDPRLRPWASRYDLRVAATLFGPDRRVPTNEEIEAFEKSAEALEHPICLVVKSEPQRLDSKVQAEAGIRSVAIDDLRIGWTGPTYAANQLVQSAESLRLAAAR